MQSQRYVMSMDITWKNGSGIQFSGRIDAALIPYVNALGMDGAAALFEAFGGSYVYLPRQQSNAVSKRLSDVIGTEGTRKLATACRGGVGGSIRLPLANVFLVRYLRSKGVHTNEISRRLRITDVAIREALLPDHVRREKSVARKAAREADAIAEAKLAALAETKPVKRVMAVPK